jgi:heparinase II/III-like protein
MLNTVENRNRAGLIVRRICRKLHYTARMTRLRLHGNGLTTDEFAARTGLHPERPWPSSPLRILPGLPVMPAVDEIDRRAARDAAALAMAHQFDLLGSGPVCPRDTNVARQARIEELSRELPNAAVAGYEPIDWHVDFRGGHRWSPDTYYLDVPVAPAPGADIKVPRELSRFQHVGALALGGGPEAADEFVLQVLDWITANPLRRGLNWASTMDVAIRAVNWIWGLRLFEKTLAKYPAALFEILRSLYEHGVHIEQNLEYYEECTSNHYLSNVAGLLYIGAACPEFPEADRWLLFGLQELVSEMRRQIYDDGADFEASTHYHRLVAEIFLSCAALAERLTSERRARLMRSDIREHRVQPRLRPYKAEGITLEASGRVLPPSFYGRLGLMAEFTAALTKPNGLVPQFGDNDNARLHKLCPIERDDSRDHRHVLAVAGALLGREDLADMGSRYRLEGELVAGGLPYPNANIGTSGTASPRLFGRAGIVVMVREPVYLAITCGPNGQGGRGGHGHNDKLSFELNIDGVDLIVDGGCFTYTGDPETRNLFRSTWAHNTVVLDNMEQDRWTEGQAGLFRLPERSRPAILHVSDSHIVAEHHGFGVPHRRAWRLLDHALEIEDRIGEAGDVMTASGWAILNLDPSVTWKIEPGSDAISFRVHLVRREGVRLLVTLGGFARVLPGEGFFSRGYGNRVSNTRLLCEMSGSSARTLFNW